MTPPGSNHDPVPPPRPMWVKVLGVVVALIVVAAVVLALMSGGQHGPGRHIPGGGEPHTAPGPHES